MRKYFDIHKYKMFPWVDDWTNSYDEYRYAKSKDVPLYKWLFFHPTAYLLAMLGTNSMTFLLFGLGAVWFFFRKNYILAVILGYISLQGVLALIKNLKNFKLIRYTTFYDIWMREI